MLISSQLAYNQIRCPACGAFSDSHGNHAISCAMAGERIARHNHLRDAIFQMAQSANLAPLKEGRAILPGTEERPADVLIPKWSGGKDTAYDVTAVNPLRLDLAKKSAEEPGFAVAQAMVMANDYAHGHGNDHDPEHGHENCKEEIL